MKVIRIYSPTNGILHTILRKLKNGLAEDIRIEYCTYLKTEKYISGGIERTINITSDKIWVTASHAFNPDDEYSIFLNNSFSYDLFNPVSLGIDRRCVKTVQVTMDAEDVARYHDKDTSWIIRSIKRKLERIGGDPEKVNSSIIKLFLNYNWQFYHPILETFGIKPGNDGEKELTLQDCYLRGDYVRTDISDTGITTINSTMKDFAHYIRYFSLYSEGRRKALVEFKNDEEFNKQVPTAISNLSINDTMTTFETILKGDLNSINSHIFGVPIFTEKTTYAKLSKRFL